jgi:hypothetical protein
LATAERLDEADEARAMLPAVVADPFAPSVPDASQQVPQLAASVDHAVGAAATASVPRERRPRKQQVPWVAIAMVTAAAAFGITAGVAIMFRPAPAPAPTVVVQAPAPTVPPPAPSAATAATPTSTESSEPIAAPPRAKGAVAAAGQAKANPSASAATARGPLDLHGLSTTNVVPADDMSGGDGTHAPGQCLTSGQVQLVYGQHAAAIRRTCWDRNPSTRLATNVSLSLTVSPDGNPQDISASGDEPSVAKCIENEVHGWRFPSMGCSQKVNIPFHFVRQ